MPRYMSLVGAVWDIGGREFSLIGTFGEPEGRARADIDLVELGGLTVEDRKLIRPMAAFTLDMAVASLIAAAPNVGVPTSQRTTAEVDKAAHRLVAPPNLRKLRNFRVVFLFTPDGRWGIEPHTFNSGQPELKVELQGIPGRNEMSLRVGVDAERGAFFYPTHTDFMEAVRVVRSMIDFINGRSSPSVEHKWIADWGNIKP